MKSGWSNPEFRLGLVLENFGLAEHNYPAGISDFALDTSLTSGFRAALIYLAIRGRYPNSDEIEELKQLIDSGQTEKAIDKVRKISSLRDSRRLLVPANEMLVDVTRYSRTAEMSGIPRVVKNLITSSPLKTASFGVWSDQVFGPVQIEKNGSVKFGRAVWGNLRSSHYLYFILRKIYFSRSTVIAKNKIVSKIFKFLNQLLFGRFLLRMVDSHAPRVGYIINPRRLIIPEVPDAQNSDLLKVWLDNVDIQESRCIVHDMLPLTHPQYFPKHAFGEHEEYLKLLRSCTTLVVGTPVLEKELQGRLGLSSTNNIIKCLPLPVNIKTSAPAQNENTQRLTFVGGYQARKGLSILVDFLERFDDSAIKFKVAVIGSPNLLSGNEEGRLFKRIGRRPAVFEIHDSLNDHMFGQLIQSSAAIIYISSAEGYGLPVLEALSLGVPVIAQATEVNQHFSSKYGGIHLLSEHLEAPDLDAFNDIAERGQLWHSLKSSILAEHLPTDVEKWADNFLKM